MENKRIIKSIFKITAIFLLVISIGFNKFYKTGAWSISSLAGSSSEIETGDWTEPYVKIESPIDEETVSGTVDIFGNVTDDDPDHYWLTSE